MPTLEFCCSGHCGWSGTTGNVPVAPVVKHITVVNTGANISVTTLGGLPAWQCAAAGARTNLEWDWPVASLPNVAVFRAYVRFSTLPNIACQVITVQVGAVAYGISFDPTGNILKTVAGAFSGGSVGISANTTYRIDCRVNVNGTSHTTEAQVDGATLSTATRTGVSASSLNDFRWGVATVGTVAVTGTGLFQAIALSRTSADYPIGAGTTIGLSPNADGTHSFNNVADFKYNNSTNMGSTSPTDIYSYLDDTPNNITDFIAMLGAVGEYCEVQFANTPSDAATINGVEVVSAHHSSGTAANKQALWLRDGSSDGLVHDDADFSAATIFVVSKHFATAPSTGTAWTKTLIDAIRARFASSKAGTPVVSPVPFLDAVILEVDYVASSTQAVTNGTIASGSVLTAPTVVATQVLTASTIISGSTLYPVTVGVAGLTLEFCCSGHCGWSGNTGNAIGNAAAVKHISAATTPAGVSVVTLSGQPAWQFTASGGGNCNLQHDFPVASLPTVAVFRAYVRFPTSLPTESVVNRISILAALDGSAPYGLDLDTATGEFLIFASSTEGARLAVAADTTYLVDIRASVGQNPQTVECRINGTPLTTLSRAAAATAFDDFRWGLGLATGSLPTGTVQIQAVALSRTSADYPIGAGKTAGLRPTADGSHSFSASGDFKYNNTTSFASGVTDVYSYLDDAPDNITDYISMHGSAGEYCEVQFADLPSDAISVNGVEVVSGHHSSGTAANTQALWLRDGTSDGVVHEDADFSAAALHIASKHFALAPSGATWTKTLVDALKARFGSSKAGTPVVSPVPFIDGLVLEVDYIGTSDQDVTNGTRASALTLFAATLIPQAVALSAGTIASTLAVTAPTAVVVGPVTVAGGTIASGSVARAPSTITTGAVTVTSGTIASGSVVFTAHAITAGPVAATGGTIASGSAATAPSTVTVGATTVVGGTIAGTTFFPPTVIPQAITITSGTVASAVVLSAPTVGAGAITVTGGTIASGSVLTAPTLAVGAVTVVGGTIASGAAVTGPAITVGAITITAGTIASGSTLSPPSVILAGAEVLTDSTVAAGGWTDQLGGTTDLHSPLADVDTLTWDQSPFNPVNATMKLGLTDLPAPGVGEKLVLSVECEQI